MFFWVNNYKLRLDSTLLVFSTLWTPITGDKAIDIQYQMNDYRLIEENGCPFTPERSTQLFQENLEFIDNAVQTNDLENCIMVTHHVPTFNNYPKEYRQSTLSAAFGVDLNAFIESSKIDYWIYGHHHRNVPAFLLGRTQMVTNQLGYISHNEHVNFKKDCIISV